jgi:hypothetical protein
VQQQEVPKEGAILKTVRALKKQYGDLCLPIGHHWQLQNWTQGDGGSWKKLAPICRRMTCGAGVAWYKGRSMQSYRTDGWTDMMEKLDQGQDCTKNPKRMNVWEETWGRTGRHQWNKDQSLKSNYVWRRRGHLAGSSGRFSCWECKVKSLAISQDLENEHQNIVERLAPSETKEETAHRVGTGDVRARATLGILPALTKRKIFIVCILWCVIMWKERWWQ